MKPQLHLRRFTPPGAATRRDRHAARGAVGRALFALALAVGLAAGGKPATAAEPGPLPWKAGVARMTITPQEPVWMAGFGSRIKPSTGVRQDIYVRALALDDGGGQPAVLVTLDLAGVEREMGEALAEQARLRFGLARERLILNSSHNHSGPVAGLVLLPLYDLNPQQREVVARYTSFLMERILATIGSALQELAPATMDFGQSLAGIAVNRRRVARRDLPGPVDPDVPVLRVRDAEGKVLAIAVGYATHPTTLGDYLIHADWPGYALAEIEAANPGVTALFVQGCGADANALPRRTEELTRMYGKILAAAVDEVLRGRMVPVAGPLAAAFEIVAVPFEPPPSRAELERRLQDPNIFVRLHARRLLSELERDGSLPHSYPYPVQVWQFGSSLKFIALGGEVVADYALRLKREHGFAATWVAGYSNDVMAYIPSRRVLEEGGYEGGGAMIYFGRPNSFAPSVEEVIVGKVRELVGRTAPGAAGR